MMKLELINFYKLGTFTTAEEVKAYLIELENNSGWIVDFLQSLRNDFKAIEEKKKQVDAYGKYLNKAEGLDAVRFQDAYNWLEVFKIYLSDKEKEYKYQTDFQEQFYSHSVKEFQKKLQKKYIADITEGWESLFDELKRKHEASLQLYDNEEQKQFVREEIDKLRNSIEKTNMLITPKAILNRCNESIEEYYSTQVYSRFHGIKFDNRVMAGNVAFNAQSNFLLVHTKHVPLIGETFRFGDVDCEKPLVKYIAEIKFLECLKSGKKNEKPPSEKVRTLFLQLAFVNKKFGEIELNNTNETKEYIKTFGNENGLILNDKLLNVAYNSSSNLKSDIELFDEAVKLYKKVFKEEPKKHKNQ